MSATHEAVRITDHVYWVGAIDWSLPDFHGYLTPRGTTYNAYLVMAQRPTLIDTVKAPFYGEMMDRVRSVIDPSQIEVIISNHSEMDHSGCLPQAIQATGAQEVYASKLGVRALDAHFGLGESVAAAADGDTLSLGDLEVSFVETRMLHWPDSMFTYLPADELLFSQDAFGMHLASVERFADEIDRSVLLWEAAKYYANILLPFSTQVLKLLDRVAGMGLPLKVLATDHGPVWRSDLSEILGRYRHWAEQTPTRKAVIVYDTMWQSTALMARCIAEGIAQGGCEVSVQSLAARHRSDIATEILDAGALLVGSPTINGTMFPTVADLLCYVEGASPQNLIGAAFGSSGWNAKGAQKVHEHLEAMGVDLVAGPLNAKYVPDEAMRQECRELGSKVAQKLRELCPD